MLLNGLNTCLITYVTKSATNCPSIAIERLRALQPVLQSICSDYLFEHPTERLTKLL